MILGQSAATAAVHAIEQEADVQTIDFDHLQQRLLDDGQVLEWGGPRRGAPMGVLPQKLPGTVVDDRQAELEGEWLPSSALGPFVGAGYLHEDNIGKGSKRARFEAELKPGRYEVRLAYSASTNRAGNVPVVVRHAGGQAETTVDQQKPGPIDGLFVSLGTFAFGEEPAVVEVSNQGTDGHVIVDAVQFLPAGDAPK